MTYLIDYNVTLNTGVLTNKTIRVKNKDNELMAKCSLEDYLKRKYPDSYVSLVITKCSPDNPFADIFGDIFNQFG